MAFTGPTIARLTNFMKTYPSQEIQPEYYDNVTLFRILQEMSDTESFVGDGIEARVQTARGSSARPHYEDGDMPYGRYPTFVKTIIPICEVIAIAAITKQVMDRAIGGDTSWGPMIDIAIRDMLADFDHLMEISASGNGTGFLARLDGAGTFDTDHHTFTVDNTYYDSGRETNQMIKEGMYVQITDSAGTTLRANSGGTTEFKVLTNTHVARNNAATITAGTVVLETASAIASTADGDVIRVAKSSEATATVSHLDAAAAATKHALPMGVTGLFHDGATGYTGICLNTTFQGLTRTSRSILKSAVYTAADFGSVKVAGQPDDWDLSTIGDAISQRKTSTGALVDVLLCHGKLATAITRKNRNESGMQVVVSNSTDQTQVATAGRRARQFETDDGRLIPIEVSDSLPPNVLYGFTKEHLRTHPLGTFDFLRLNGREWDKSYDDRKTNFEAPYGGYLNNSARRCDGAFVLMDMRTDV